MIKLFMLLVTLSLLCCFSMISAYTLKFRIPKSGLGFDYIVFTIILVLSLKLGGVI